METIGLHPRFVRTCCWVVKESAIHAESHWQAGGNGIMATDLRLVDDDNNEEDEKIVASIRPLAREVQPSPIFRAEMRNRLMELMRQPRTRPD